VVNTRIPSVEELRELLQLRRELNEMYQTSSQAPFDSAQGRPAAQQSQQ